MGVTIHYRGRLDDVGRLPALCDEVSCFAEAMGWKTTRLDDDWDQPANARLEVGPRSAEIVGHLGLKGILIAPGNGSESVDFFFDRDGNLRSPMDVISIVEGSLKPEEAWEFVKTQFAPPETHMWIVGILRYVKKHYMSDLEVRDEGEYWDTGDAEILKGKIDFINEKIDFLARELSSPRFEGGENLSAEEIASKIEELLQGHEDRENEHDG